MTDVDGPTYQLSAADINKTIQVEVEALSRKYKGTAILVFGPIKIHPETKLTLEEALFNGGIALPV